MGKSRSFSHLVRPLQNFFLLRLEFAYESNFRRLFELKRLNRMLNFGELWPGEYLPLLFVELGLEVRPLFFELAC